MANPQTTRTMCPMNCHPTFCGTQVTVEDDRLIEIKGDPDNPDSEGFLCVRGRAAEEIIDNPQRILHPLARDKHADGDWQQISWDQALERITTTINNHRRDQVGLWSCHGAVANDYGVFANAGLTARLSLRAGFQVWSGAMEVNTKEDMSANSDLIVQWGSNQASQPNTARHIAAAHKRGARVIAIDVRESEGCRAADDHFIVKPGTDAALALVMMHVILAENLHDQDFVAEHTVGFAELEQHLQSSTPEWAADICGVNADHPCTGHMTVAKLREIGGIAALNVSHVAYPNHRYTTPSGKVELYSELAEQSGLPPLPTYQPRESSAFPLELRMGRTMKHFHAFYDSGRALPSLVRRDQAPKLWISEADAASRNINHGDSIRLHNQRGTFPAVANVTPRVPQGTVWIHDGWPGLNDLTNGAPAISDQVSTLFPFSTGQAAYDAFVEVSAA